MIYSVVKELEGEFDDFVELWTTKIESYDGKD